MGRPKNAEVKADEVVGDPEAVETIMQAEKAVENLFPINSKNIRLYWQLYDFAYSHEKPSAEGIYNYQRELNSWFSKSGEYHEYVNVGPLGGPNPSVKIK